MKKLLCLLLSAAMLLGAVPVSALASENGETPPPEDSGDASPSGAPEDAPPAEDSGDETPTPGDSPAPIAVEAESYEDDTGGGEWRVNIRWNGGEVDFGKDNYSQSQLPEGVSFTYDEASGGKLTLSGASLTSLHFNDWGSTKLTIEVTGTNTIANSEKDRRALGFWRCHDITMTGGGTLTLSQSYDDPDTLIDPEQNSEDYGGPTFEINDCYVINNDTGVSEWHSNPDGKLTVDNVTLDITNGSQWVYKGYDEYHKNDYYNFPYNTSAMNLNIGGVELKSAIITASGLSPVSFNGNVNVDAGSFLTANALDFSGFSEYKLADGNLRTVTVKGAVTVTGVTGTDWVDEYMNSEYGVGADMAYMTLLRVSPGAALTLEDGGKIDIKPSDIYGPGLEAAALNDDPADPTSQYLEAGKVEINGGTLNISVCGSDTIAVGAGASYAQTGGEVTADTAMKDGGAGAAFRVDGNDEKKWSGAAALSGGTLTLNVDVSGSLTGEDRGANAVGLGLYGYKPVFTVSGSAALSVKVSGEFTGGGWSSFQGVQLQGYGKEAGASGQWLWYSSDGAALTVKDSAQVTVDMTGVAPFETVACDGLLAEYGSAVSVTGGKVEIKMPAGTFGDNNGIRLQNAGLTLEGGEVDVTLASGDTITEFFNAVAVYAAQEIVADGQTANSSVTVKSGTLNVTLSGTVRGANGINGNGGDVTVSGGAVKLDLSGVSCASAGEDGGCSYNGIFMNNGDISMTGGTVEIKLPSSPAASETGIYSSGSLEIGGTAKITVTGGTGLDGSGGVDPYFMGIQSGANTEWAEDGTVTAARASAVTIGGSAEIAVTLPSGRSVGGGAISVSGADLTMSGGTVNVTVPDGLGANYVTLLDASSWQDGGYREAVVSDFTVSGGAITVSGSGILSGSNLRVFGVYGGSEMEISGSADIDVSLSAKANPNPEDYDGWGNFYGFNVEKNSTLTVSGGTVDYDTTIEDEYQIFLNLRDHSAFNQTGGAMIYTPSGEENRDYNGTQSPMGVFAEDFCDVTLTGGSLTVKGMAGMGVDVKENGSLTINGTHKLTVDTFNTVNGPYYTWGIYVDNSELTVSGSPEITLELPRGRDGGGVSGIQLWDGSTGLIAGGKININQGASNKCTDIDTQFRQGITVWNGSTLRFSGGEVHIRATQPLNYSYRYIPSVTYADGINANFVENGSADRAMQLYEYAEEDGWSYAMLVSPDIDVDDDDAQLPPDTDVLITAQGSAAAEYDGTLELVNAGALTAGMSYNARYIATLSTSKGDVTFTLSGASLVEGSVTVNSQKATTTGSGNTFTVHINSGDVVRFEIVPAAGENTITASVGGEDKNTVEFTAAAYTFSLPSQVKDHKITVSGTAAAGAEVKIYVGEEVSATVTASQGGSWSAEITLKTGENEVYAVVTPASGSPATSKTYTVTCSPDAAVVESLTVSNWIHGRTSIDPNEQTSFTINFMDGKKTSSYYTYWPELPEFTFEVKFYGGTGTPDKVKDVTVVATDWKGREQTVYLGYDSASGAWVGVHDFCDDGNIVPEKFRVEWRGIDDKSDSSDVEEIEPGLDPELFGAPTVSDADDPDTIVEDNGYDYTDMDYVEVDADVTTFTIKFTGGDPTVTKVLGDNGTEPTFENGEVTLTGKPGDLFIVTGTLTDYPHGKVGVKFTGSGAPENTVVFGETVVTDATLVDGKIVAGGTPLEGMRYAVIANRVYRIGEDNTAEDITDVELPVSEVMQIYKELNIGGYDGDWEGAHVVDLTGEQKAEAVAAFIDSPLADAVAVALEAAWSKTEKGTLKIRGVEYDYELTMSIEAAGGDSVKVEFTPKFIMNFGAETIKRDFNIPVDVTVELEFSLTGELEYRIHMTRDGSEEEGYTPNIDGNISLTNGGELKLTITGINGTHGSDSVPEIDQDEYFTQLTKERFLEELKKTEKTTIEKQLCEFLFPIPAAPAVQMVLRVSSYLDYNVFGEFTFEERITLPTITTTVVLLDNTVSSASFDYTNMDTEVKIDLHAGAMLGFGLKMNFGLTVFRSIEASLYLRTGPELSVRGHTEWSFMTSSTSSTSEFAFGAQLGWNVTLGVEFRLGPIKNPIDLYEHTFPLWQGGLRVMPTRFKTINSKDSPITVDAECDLKNVIDLEVLYQKLVGSFETDSKVMEADRYRFELLNRQNKVALEGSTIHVLDTSSAFEFNVKVYYETRAGDANSDFDYTIWKIETLKYNPTAIKVIKVTEDGGSRDATFQIIDSSDPSAEPITFNTGEAGMFMFQAIPGHKYIITETSWPAPYHPLTTTQTVTAPSDRKDIPKVVFKNVLSDPEEPEPKQHTQDEPVDSNGDPSGYVYEGITSNRLSGVTVTIYKANDNTGAGSAVWAEAEAFDQSATLKTDLLGQYLWMVPSGWWRVEYKLDGYTTQYSNWMDVPPVRTDVNHNMVSIEPAEMTVTYDPARGAFIVRFSRPVQVSDVRSMTYTVLGLENVDVYADVAPVDGDWSVMENSTYCATTFIITLEVWGAPADDPDGEWELVDLTGRTVTVSAGNVRTYNNAKNNNLKSDPVTVEAPEKEFYSVTVVNGSGSASQVRPGETVTVQADPAPSGQVFDGWDVECSVSLPVPNTATASFTMPAADVTLRARYRRISYVPPTPSEPEEKDLTDPEVNGVAMYLDTKNHTAYIHGFGDGTLRPNDTLTRAQAAYILYSLLLEKTPGEAVFEDVSPTAYYYDAVNTLHAMGIINGRTAALFCPDEPVKRSEFVAMCVRFAEAVDAENKFTDVPGDYWAVRDISAAVTFGWITGRTATIFDPEAPIARAEAVSVVNRMLKRSADRTQAGRMPDFSDLSPDHWAFYQLLEAAVSHSYTASGGQETWTDAHE